MSKNFGCSECDRTFGRKYNGERHNRNNHDDLAIIYDKRLKSNVDNTVAFSKSDNNLKNPFF